MTRLIPLIFLALSCGAYASQKLGLKDISVVSLDGKMILQINHLFLGAGNRQANITFYGCSEGIKKYQIENEIFSEFELIECTLNSAEDIYVDLSYGPENLHSNILRYKVQDIIYGNKSYISQIEWKKESQIENYFSATLYLTEGNRNGIFTIHTVDKHGVCSTDEIVFSIMAGNNLYYSKWLKEGDVIKEVIVNGTKLEFEYERIGFE